MWNEVKQSLAFYLFFLSYYKRKPRENLWETLNQLIYNSFSNISPATKKIKADRRLTSDSSDASKMNELLQNSTNANTETKNI